MRPVSTFLVIAFSVVAVAATFLTWYSDLQLIVGNAPRGSASAWGVAAALYSSAKIFGLAMYTALGVTMLCAVALVILVGLRLATRQRGPQRLILALGVIGLLASAGLTGGYSLLGLLSLSSGSWFIPMFGASFLPVAIGAAGLTVRDDKLVLAEDVDTSQDSRD